MEIEGGRQFAIIWKPSMKLLISGAVAWMLLSGLTVAAAAAPVAASPMHEQYLPPDDLSLREGAPEQQQLMRVTEYTIVAGNQRQSSQQPIPVTSPLSMRLKGKSLNKGASISQVLVHFDGGDSKSLKKPTYDEPTTTLTLYYPLAQYRVLVDLLRNEKVYCQFLSYANGHIWADLHTTSARAR
ncbi:hypothetical protein ALO97_02951 [Pseudomonas syringae pv. tagetis]|uniref:Uncharacterized protein n=3 Tax=Pseudomonas syringae group genomosp. 7 TaxID=251699 RepID=A0A0Q0HEU6_9PSED|nr:Uncharacterized protein ALO44_04477 [Pseudomonas syringae pv. tagetis]RMW07892.1 hypothetical protein ALO98_04227 [Pseudomonas syringae pv. tagetis]RMW14233.1 hypothetical protein ALO97_02951 [Pseudomonas syringae pv. tagetis]